MRPRIRREERASFSFVSFLFFFFSLVRKGGKSEFNLSVMYRHCVYVGEGKLVGRKSRRNFKSCFCFALPMAMAFGTARRRWLWIKVCPREREKEGKGTKKGI